MRVLSLFTIFAIIGCTGLFAVEGANPGECTDDADNDGDGLFDCDDTDCVGASSCATPSGDADADSDTDADSDSDADSDADPTFDVSWNSNGMTLSIDGGSGGYMLGMNEMGDSEAGWHRESCVEYVDGYRACHDDVPKGGITLQTAYDYTEVEANVSTLFSNSTDSGVTYAVFGDDGCWTWGEDPDWYIDEADCVEP